MKSGYRENSKTAKRSKKWTLNVTPKCKSDIGFALLSQQLYEAYEEMDASLHFWRYMNLNLDSSLSKSYSNVGTIFKAKDQNILLLLSWKLSEGILWQTKRRYEKEGT